MTSAEPGTRAEGRVWLQPVSLGSLPNFAGDDLSAAMTAFRRQALEIIGDGSGFSRLVHFGGRRDDWLPVCREALTASDPHAFFTQAFRAYRVLDQDRPDGLFTGYYEPEVEGSRATSPDFPVPVYRKPEDLVAFTSVEEHATGLKYGRRAGGMPLPYHDRKTIESGALAARGLEICWLRDWVEAFFVHIQGSGRVRLTDGSTLRLSYSGKSGLPYTSIGAVLADRGEIPRQALSMQRLKSWMADNPAAARQLMWHNKSFVFFREIAVEDDGLGAVGAARVNLHPGRSMAVDRSNWMFGTPCWVETAYPAESVHSSAALARLMIAQDTGSAIKGYARGDFYWGWGDDAAQIAGHMKSPGQLTVLLPHEVADHLGLPR